MSRLGDSMDVPFEDGPPGQFIDLEHAHVSGGMVVMAAVLPVDGDPKPTLVFRFATPLGTFYPPMVLVLDDDQVRNVPDLVTKAVHSAVRAAKEAS